MVKGCRISVILILLTLTSSLLAQQPEQKREFNPLYDPLSVIKRESYDNFKKIKLIHTAILNFGGGDAEFNRLVDEYAEASALYFRESMVESANLFTRNEKNINTTAASLAQKYKADTEALHTDIIKVNVKKNIDLSLNGKASNPSADLLVGNAAFAIRKANDYIAQARPIDAIYYYRRAKESCFKYFEVTGQPIPEKYKKDAVDVQNKVYISKEKEK